MILSKLQLDYKQQDEMQKKNIDIHKYSIIEFIQNAEVHLIYNMNTRIFREHNIRKVQYKISRQLILIPNRG